jgi:hypothetical protein
MTMIMQKIRKGIGVLALGAATLLGAGCGSSGRLIDNPSGYAETSIVSDSVTQGGALTKGPANQNLISGNANDRLSAFVWNWNDLRGAGCYETDIGASYKVPVSDSLSVNGGAQYWKYPNGAFGNHDIVLTAGANYSGFVNVGLDVTQLMKQGPTDYGTRYYAKASKGFVLHEDKERELTITLTPGIASAFMDNYYGRNRFSHVTPSVSLGVQVGRFGFKGFVNQQVRLEDYVENHTWGGVSLGVGF